MVSGVEMKTMSFISNRQKTTSTQLAWVIVLVNVVNG